MSGSASRRQAAARPELVEGRAAPAVGRRAYVRGATIALMLLPAGALYVVLVLLPIIQSSFFSIYSWSCLGPLEDFVAIDNYTRALNDGLFLSSLGHNVLIVVLSVGLQLPMSLGLALLVGR